MDAPAIVLSLCLTIGISALVVIRLNRRDDASDEITYGDWPAIPEGMRPATRTRGDGAASSSGPVTIDVRTHREAGK